MADTTYTMRQALNLWREALVENVRREGPDLSARQMALVLTVYLTPEPHTAGSLATTLNVSKPAITRALDSLGRLGFVRRTRDGTDRRSVLVLPTIKGSVYLSDFAWLIAKAGEGMEG
jgi:DNA-binding MarR family transcriptional regulator